LNIDEAFYPLPGSRYAISWDRHFWISDTLKFSVGGMNPVLKENLINDLNNVRHDYFKVPQINETHVLNYFLSEVKNSIKI